MVIYKEKTLRNQVKGRLVVCTKGLKEFAHWFAHWCISCLFNYKTWKPFWGEFIETPFRIASELNFPSDLFHSAFYITLFSLSLPPSLPKIQAHRSACLPV